VRIVSRLIALAVALALAVGGVLVAVEIVVAELGRDPWAIPHDDWYLDARENAWSSQGARILFLVLALAGLALLVLQVARRRPRVLAMEDRKHGRSVAVSRRTLEHSLVRSVTRVDGVATAKARLWENRARVTASTNRRLPGDLLQRVTQTAEQRLSGMRLATTPVVVVRLHHRGPG
jgi:hypothetical protein